MGAFSLDIILSQVDALPTLPTVEHRVRELVQNPSTDSGAVASVMMADQSLTARVLSLVNSAHYAIPGGVSDVRRAISLLGFNAVYQLVLTVSVFDTLPQVRGRAFSVKSLWRHSLGCAIASEILAGQLKMAAPEELFSAGLLHDIGKVLLAAFCPNELQSVVDSAMKEGITFRESELRAGLPGHDEMGRRLARRWRLPTAILAGIGYHHQLNPHQRAHLARHLRPTADVVALSNIMCRRCGARCDGDNVAPDLNADLIERLGLEAAIVNKMEDEIPAHIKRSEAFLEVLA